MLTHQQRIAMYENEIARLYEWKDDIQKDVTYYKNESQNLKVKIGHLQEMHREKTREINELNKMLYTTIVDQKRLLEGVSFKDTENPYIVETMKKMYHDLSKAIEESR